MAKIVVLGMGHSMRGDDRLGIEVLAELHKAVHNPDVTLLCCEEAPESFIGQIPKSPDILLIVDAIDMDDSPGSIKVLKLQDWDDGFTTHKLPLTILKKLVRPSLAMLIGVQPKSLRYSESLSPELQNAKRKLIGILTRFLNQSTDSSTCDLEEWLGIDSKQHHKSG